MAGSSSKPEVRRQLIKAIDGYTTIYRKGCTPPSSIDWDSNLDNNKKFPAQAVVMVLNDTLSIPNALKRERSEDYYKNTATIEWPLGPADEAFPIFGNFWGAVFFKDGRHVDAAKELVAVPRGPGYSLRICLIRVIASSTTCSGLMPSARMRWTALA